MAFLKTLSWIIMIVSALVIVIFLIPESFYLDKITIKQRKMQRNLGVRATNWNRLLGFIVSFVLSLTWILTM